MEFYHTAGRTFTELLEDGRRQLQAHVRRRASAIWRSGQADCAGMSGVLEYLRDWEWPSLAESKLWNEMERVESALSSPGPPRMPPSARAYSQGDCSF